MAHLTFSEEARKGEQLSKGPTRRLSQEGARQVQLHTVQSSTRPAGWAVPMAGVPFSLLQFSEP